MPRPTAWPINLSYWFVHAGIVVKRFNGTEAYGDDYDTPETLTGFVDHGEDLVAGPGGEMLTSIARVYLPIETAWVPLQSRVTLPAEFDSQVCEVIAVNKRDTGALPLPKFLELALR